MGSRFIGALALSAALMSAQAGFAKDCRLTVYFGLDQANLTPEMQNVLFSFVTHNPRATGSVIGHTDALASQEYNIDLSKRRALMVVNFIEQFRANSVSLAADWRGKMNLVVDSPSAEALNRRVEIYYHNCAPVNVLSPLPPELRGYVAPASGEQTHTPATGGGSGSSASAGGGGSSASSSGSGGSSSASAGASGTSAASSGTGGAAAASAGSSGTSASTAGSGSAAAASAGGSGTSVSSAGSGSSGAASAGAGGTSASGAGSGGASSASAGGQGTSASTSSSSGSYSASAGNGQTSVSSTGG